MKKLSSLFFPLLLATGLYSSAAHAVGNVTCATAYDIEDRRSISASLSKIPQVDQTAARFLEESENVPVLAAARAAMLEIDRLGFGDLFAPMMFRNAALPGLGWYEVKQSVFPWKAPKSGEKPGPLRIRFMINIHWGNSDSTSNTSLKRTREIPLDSSEAKQLATSLASSSSPQIISDFALGILQRENLIVQEQLAFYGSLPVQRELGAFESVEVKGRDGVWTKTFAFDEIEQGSFHPGPRGRGL